MTETQTAHDLGPLPAHAVLWGPHGITGYTDEQMRVERLRCYFLGEAAERERWQRIATNAQAVTTGSKDKIDHFAVPSHLMAALALALDEGPNVRAEPDPKARGNA